MNNIEEKLSSKATSVRFTNTMYKKIVIETKRLHLRKKSDVIRKALDEYFENHKKEIEGAK